MSCRQFVLSSRHEVLAEDEFENECSGEERVLSPPISKDRYRTRIFLARKISCNFQFNVRRSTFLYQANVIVTLNKQWRELVCFMLYRMTKKVFKTLDFPLCGQKISFLCYILAMSALGVLS
jgi:hypothetical protein